MSLTYLASPYSAPTEEQRKINYDLVRKKAGQMMVDGWKIFCPIAHSVPIDETFDKIKDGHFWLAQDAAVLEKCDRLMVYKIPGWDKSYGVFTEIVMANHWNIPVSYIEYVPE